MRTVISESFRRGPHGNARHSLDAGTHTGIGGILMRKLVFGATLAFACLGATWASADSVLHTSDSHFAADPGYGSWTHNFSTRPSAGESASVVSGAAVSSAANEVVDLHLVGPGRHDLTGLRAWRLRLRSDADCVFVSTDGSAGDLWRPGCK